MTRAIVWAGFASLALSIGYLSAADDKAAAGVPISEPELKLLVKNATANIKSGLSTKGKAGTTKARGAALMLAAYAQYAEGPPEGTRATLREAAVKLANDISAGKADAAKAEALNGLKGEGKVATGPIMKETKGSTVEVMRQFSPNAVGGLNIEDRLKKLTAGGNALKEKAMDENFVAELEQCAAMFALIRDNPPAKDAKTFSKLAEDSRALAVLTAEAGKKKDGVAAAASLYKLTISCNKCHDKFRE